MDENFQDSPRLRQRTDKGKFSNGGASAAGGRGDSDETSVGPPQDDSAATNSKAMFIVFFSLMLDLVAFTIILPLLPSILDLYAQKNDGIYNWMFAKVTDFRDFIGAPGTPKLNSVLFGGAIGSLFSLLQFMSSPVIGGLSDVYGRKPILLICLVGIAGSYAVWAMSKNFSMFVLARILGGISKGNVSLSTAIVTDASTTKTRAKGMALVGVAFSVGFVIGPIIGAFFARWARENKVGDFYAGPALFALVLAILDILFIAVMFKETLPPQRRATSLSINGIVDYISPVALFKYQALRKISTKELSSLRRIGVVYFLYLFLYSGLEFTLTFLTHLRFNYDSMQQGKMFLFIGLIMSLVQGGFVRRIKPGSEKRMALMGLIAIIPSFLIIGYSRAWWQLYSGLAIYSFASATVVPCLTTIASTHGKVTQKGTVMGIFRSLGALARALGPIFASILYWTMGALSCYTICALLLVSPLLLLLKHKSAVYAVQD